MTPRELNLKLLAAFPELERAYREETSWQEGDDTGSHVIPFPISNVTDSYNGTDFSEKVR
jgi:hypothetical protein